MIREVSPGVTQFALPTPFRVGTVNVYLLEGRPLTLVDTGPRWPAAVAALEHGLATCGHRLDDIDAVLLTHQDFDHVGAAEIIRRRSGATVFATPPLAGYLDEYPGSIAADDAYAEAIMQRYAVPLEQIRAVREITRSFWGYAERVQVEGRLAVGAEIEAAGRKLRVLTRPGHSPTDTLFVDEEAHAAFVGDHLIGHISSNPVVRRPLEGNTEVAARASTLATYLESLAATAALQLRLALPGHGTVLTAPNEVIRTRIKDHEERKRLIASLIAARSRSVYELAQILWGEVEQSQVYLAVSEVLGHTDLLVAEGFIRERADSSGIIFETVS